MLTRHQQYESFDHLVRTRLRPGGDPRPVRFVVFGGTGAVGGAVVLLLARLLVEASRDRGRELAGELWVTGRSNREIAQFARRLWLAFEGRAEIEKLRPRRHYRLGGVVDVRLAHFNVGDLGDVEEHVAGRAAAAGAAGEAFDPATALADFFAALPSPFLDFVVGLGHEWLDGVVVGIPLPSVATYTLTALDRLAERHGLAHGELNRLKDQFLASFLRGLGIVRERHARRVMMAHTTAVGGMYRVDGSEPEIRLGFAHSASGKQLADKKYFADRLTQGYLDQGFDVLVTAAAIGIDAVEFNLRLPMARGARQALEAACADPASAPLHPEDLEQPWLHLYPGLTLPFDGGGEGGEQPLRFGSGGELRVEAAVRSGENGFFSVANSYALYHVMKVAIPEELATVIVRRLIGGRERRRDPFVGGLCYYTETENAHLALRVLDSDERLVRAHLGAFAVQAFQELGSATHQARLHELGILVLLLRLLDLGRRLPGLDAAALEEAVRDVGGFVQRQTVSPYFEDLLDHDAPRLARLAGELCEVRDRLDVGRLLGYDPRHQARRDRRREKLLERLAKNVRRYLSTITSLGTPIVYSSPGFGRDEILLGPYVAPLDLAVGSSGDLQRRWAELAAEHGLEPPTVRDWTLVNNGFVDLRAHALATSARELGPQLGERLLVTGSAEELAAWLAALPRGSYFTTCGLVATLHRLGALHRRLRGRRVELGTHETWKHLFFRDRGRGPRGGAGRGRRGDERPFVLAPGLVETARMYSEGLGKVTGSENLWPGWGY